MSKDTRCRFATVILLFVLGLAPFSSEAVTAAVKSPYLYNFDTPGFLVETSALSESSSPYWWVNSGAGLEIKDDRGHTVQGSLPALEAWRLIYALSNPVDTDNGYHPQNIFRLVTKSRWKDFSQEAYFIIERDNLSRSGNRNESNGLLFFNRYEDGDNLYYAGLRVDGAAVIKKKINGVYHTLAYEEGIYPGTYNRSSKPNLLPKGKWIGLRSEVKNQPDGSVLIRLYIDKGWQGEWQLVASAVDNGRQFGPVISGLGYAGIRTDFMDVTFENFKLRTI